MDKQHSSIEPRTCFLLAMIALITLFPLATHASGIALDRSPLNDTLNIPLHRLDDEQGMSLLSDVLMIKAGDGIHMY